MKLFKYFLLISLGLSFQTIYCAESKDLIEVYNLALSNDKQFLSDKANLQAKSEVLAQSISQVLPNINGTVNYSKTKSNNQLQINNNAVVNTHSYSINLTQPILDFNKWASIGVSNDLAKSYQAQYLILSQNLIINVVKSYLDVLYNKQALENAKTKLQTDAKQLNQTKAKFKAGLETVTSVYSAKAAYDLDNSNILALENNYEISIQNLKKIAGNSIVEIKSFREMPMPSKPNPTSLRKWVDYAIKNNAQIISTRFQMEAAKTDVQANKAINYPTIALEGSYGRNYAPNYVNNKQYGSAANNLSLQLNVPLFQGGYGISKIKEKKSAYEALKYDLEDLINNTTYTMTATYDTVLSDIEKLKADQTAIKSAKAAFNTAYMSYKAGVSNILDSLYGRQRMYDAELTWIQDTYKSLNDVIAMKAVAGLLNYKDIQKINGYLR